jgi:hypothetical protein
MNEREKKNKTDMYQRLSQCYVEMILVTQASTEVQGIYK